MKRTTKYAVRVGELVSANKDNIKRSEWKEGESKVEEQILGSDGQVQPVREAKLKKLITV